MRVSRRAIAVGLAVAAIALVSIACTKKDSGTAGGAAGAGGPVRTSTPEPTALSATLSARGGGQASGTAQFVPGSPGTRVTLEMKSLPSGPKTAYIYKGSCEGAGQRFGPLTTLEPAADGSATSSTNFVSFTLGQFLDGEHFLSVHAGTGDNAGAVLSCGKIEAGGGAASGGGGAAATATGTPAR